MIGVTVFPTILQLINIGSPCTAYIEFNTFYLNNNSLNITINKLNKIYLNRTEKNSFVRKNSEHFRARRRLSKWLWRISKNQAMAKIVFNRQRF